MVGILECIMRLLRLGGFICFIRHSDISGFTTSSTIVIALSQAKYILGYSIVQSSKIVPFVKNIVDGASKETEPTLSCTQLNKKLTFQASEREADLTASRCGWILSCCGFRITRSSSNHIGKIGIHRLKNQMNFSAAQNSTSAHLSRISEMGNDEEPILENGIKRMRSDAKETMLPSLSSSDTQNGEVGNNPSTLSHQFSLPNTSSKPKGVAPPTPGALLRGLEGPRSVSE